MAGYGEQCWEFLVGDDFNGAKLDGFEGASAAAKSCVVVASDQTQVAEGLPGRWANAAVPMTFQTPRGVTRSQTETPPKFTRPLSESHDANQLTGREGDGKSMRSFPALFQQRHAHWRTMAAWHATPPDGF